VVSATPPDPGSAKGLAGLRVSSPAGRWVLVGTVLGSTMAVLDATVVGIALPSIGREFHVGVSDLQWVVNAYTLTLAGLLLLGGALGDRYGRQRIFQVGVIWFALASLACAVAPDGPTLIVTRALQGVGAALLTPESLAILQASFSSEDRSRAIGAWSGFGGIGTAIGPFLGGWLISAVSWRLIFLINLPIAAAVLAISARHVPESRDPSVTGRIDIPGAAAITIGLIGLTFGLIEGPSLHWTSPGVLASLLIGIVLLAGFPLVERREHNPMVQVGLFASTQFTTANGVTFIVYGALSATLFLLPTVLQTVKGYSPLLSGVALLPITLIMLALSARSGALTARIGPRLQMTVGPLVIAAGLALFARIDASGSYVTEVLPAVIVFGLGLAINVAPLTATALAAVPAEHAGIASAVNNDVARAGGLIAVAVLPVAAGITGDTYLHAAALSSGFHTAVLIAAATCAVAGVLAAAGIRNVGVRQPRRPSPPEPHCCALDATPLRDHQTASR
jgi:EmrB/QacA subfamily drug resistance transporter